MNEPQKITVEMLEETARVQPEELSQQTFRWLAQIACGRLAVLVHEMFGQIDEKLFEQAEQVRGAGRNVWAEGLREVRGNRDALTFCFKNQLVRDFDTLEKYAQILEPGTVLEDDEAEDETDSEGNVAAPRPLEALAPESMQTIGDMQARAESAQFRALNELNQHLSDITVGDGVQLEHNPLAPGNLCRCFQYALNLLTLDAEVETRILELFDRYVIAQSRFVLDHVNGQLRDIARLKDQLGTGGEPRKLNQLFSTVRGLLASKRAQDLQPEGGARPAPPPPPPPSQASESPQAPASAAATDDRAPADAADNEDREVAREADRGPQQEPEPVPRRYNLNFDVEDDAWDIGGGALEGNDEAAPVPEALNADAKDGVQEDSEDDEAGLTLELEGVDLEDEGDDLDFDFDFDEGDLVTDDGILTAATKAEGAAEATPQDASDGSSEDVLEPVAETDPEPAPAPVPSAAPFDVPDLAPLPELQDGETRIIQTMDILAVLDQMQADPDWADPDPFGLDPEAAVSFSEELRRRLDERREEYAEAEFSEDDEGTVDLVELVFDFVLHDHNLPAPLQKMLAHLQVPYLRVALLDWQLFALSDHPARLLLDELARAAQGWTEEADEEREIYQRIEVATEAILSDRQGNATLFRQLLDGFSRFMRHFEARASDAERRALEAMRERERLKILRLATEAIRERLPEDPVPALVDELLRRTMPELLVQYGLDFGVDSEQWTEALDIVDGLVVSTLSRETPDEIEALAEHLPDLYYALNRGLDMLGIDDFLKEKIFDRLGRVYRKIGGDDLKLPADPAEPPGAAAATPTTTEDADLAFDEAVQLILGLDPGEAVQPVTAESLHEALAGSWFEFRYAGQAPARAKMSWSKPVSSKYLFVDQNGNEVAEKTLNELAAEIQGGQAVMLESVPLFERALSAIAERLLSEQGDADAS